MLLGEYFLLKYCHIRLEGVKLETPNTEINYVLKPKREAWQNQLIFKARYKDPGK